jgi:arginine decarboxylase
MISLAIILCIAAVIPIFGETTYSTRVPTTYFATTGTGQSDEGIPPDPYETFSYDLALLEAGIENFNVVYYTSVLPKESYEVPLAKVKPYFHHGAVLETIMAKAGGYKGDTVAAGIGRVWAVDSDGTYIGGFAAEYEFVYSREQVDPQTASNAAIAQLTKSLQHELDIRGLQMKPGTTMTFNTTSLYIEKKYGIALAALGFVNYIFPDPMPISPGKGKKPRKKRAKK